MEIARLEVQNDYLERLVKTPWHGLEELVWNAIDADATHITCRLERTVADSIDALIIEDNGTGFNRERAELSFGKLGGSWKAQAIATEAGRAIHGRAGQGRFAAFGIGDATQWTTTAESVVQGQFATHRVTGNRGDMQQMGISEIAPLTTTGTTVEIIQLNAPALKWVGSRKPIERLTTSFALALEQYRVELSWDGELVDPREVQGPRHIEEFTVDALGQDQGHIELVIIEWTINTGRQLLLCDDGGVPLHETKAGIQAPGFNFTAYVKWRGFSEFAPNLVLDDFAPESVKAVVEAARQRMRVYFSDRVRDKGRKLIDSWITEKSYPYREQASSELEQAERNLFDIVAVTAATGFKDGDKKSRKLSLRLIREALENNPGGLHDVIAEVIGLPEADLDDLSSLLKSTPLSSVIQATREITDRLKFLVGLQEMIYGDDLRKTLLERSQLHRILEAETWVFREEYSLTADDVTLKTALSNHTKLLGREGVTDEDVSASEVMDYNDGTLVVDLMLSRVIEQQENKRHHIVIELKRPNVHIGHTQINQIERYAAAVVEDGRFDMSSTTWEFWIVGDKIASAAKMKTSKSGIIQEPTTEYPVTIRAVAWNQIIQDARHRLKFVQNAMAYSPTTESSMKHLNEKHGRFLPSPIITEDAA